MSERLVFIQADSSQAEARVVFLLANDEQALKDIDEHDYHALTASWFFGQSEETWSKKVLGYEHPVRFAGKCQPLHSKVLTPNGFKEFGTLKIGDEICNNLSYISKIIGIYPQGIKEVFKVKFSDGSEVESCREHLWPIIRQGNEYQILKLNEILKDTLRNKKGFKYSNPIYNYFYFHEQEIPIDPYVFGLLLGDGSFKGTGVTFVNQDLEIVTELMIRLPNKIHPLRRIEYWISDIKEQVIKLKLWDKYSYEKFIPEIYKFNSLDKRIWLLRGLMDTDGTIHNKDNSITYTTTSKQLASDVVDLVRSIGGWASLTKYQPKYENSKLVYTIAINIKQVNPFKLKRKADKWNVGKSILRRNIISIEKSGEFECQCISVDSKDNLYVTDDFILTHNTLRHAGHLGAGKRRAATELNTQARKYKIPISINEAIAERALKIFHMKQPKIQQVFQAGIIEALKEKRQLVAPLPYGIDAPIGGLRTFYERWGDELNRQAFSYIPQRAVSDNTKCAALRIKQIIPDIRIVLESHDALLFCIRKKDVDIQGPIIKQEMERPLNFSNCSLRRRNLIIPCELEIGENYKDLSKFKFTNSPITTPIMPIKSITEQFLANTLPKDTYLDNIIYESEMNKK